MLPLLTRDPEREATDQEGDEHAICMREGGAERMEVRRGAQQQAGAPRHTGFARTDRQRVYNHMKRGCHV